MLLLISHYFLRRIRIKIQTPPAKMTLMVAYRTFVTYILMHIILYARKHATIVMELSVLMPRTYPVMYSRNWTDVTKYKEFAH